MLWQSNYNVDFVENCEQITYFVSKSNQKNMTNSQLLLYQTEDGQTKIDVRLEEDTVWLSIKQMSQLFQRDRSAISKHIRNIFTENELEEELVCAKFAHTTQHGAIKGRLPTKRETEIVKN